MAKKGQGEKTRDSVVATVRAIKYHADKLKRYQEGCAHAEVKLGRCCVCLKIIKTE